MPELANRKHEAFADGLARGYTQIQAYVQAGYNKQASSASALAKSPAIVARVKELKDEYTTLAQKAADSATLLSLEELDSEVLSLEWVELQYKRLMKSAEDDGKWTAALTAVDKLHRILDIKKNRERPDEGKETIPIKAVDMMLEKIIAIQKSVQPLNVIDVTPEDGKDSVEIPEILLENIEDDNLTGT